MVRIDIEWKFLSPSLGIASGIVKIIEKEEVLSQENIILKCYCRIERGSTGFHSFENTDGIPTKIFDKYEELIKCMMSSYFEGLLLNKKMYHWVEESFPNDKNTNEN